MTRSLTIAAAAFCALVFTTAALLAPGAEAADGNWSRHVDGPITAKQLDLPSSTGPSRLGRAAIERSARKLTGGGRLGPLDAVGRLSTRPPGGRAATTLRFRQSLDGRRVLWSQLNVLVQGSTVTSISGTVVPLRTAEVTGTRRISPAQARRIARRAVAGAARVRPAEFVVYAGEPEKPRRPRSAYVVEATTTRAKVDDSPTICVVIDAESGKVLKRWWGSAARIGAQPSTRAARTAQARNYLVQVADNKLTNVDLANDGANFYTPGNPYTWGSDSTRERELFGSPSTAFLTGAGQPYGVIAGATGFFCLKRNYCGRDSGQPGPVGNGDLNRWFFSARFAGCRSSICNTSHYSSALDRIFLTVTDTNDWDTIAHEIGHVIDRHMRDDYIQTFEGSEVQEALAEMFAYDSAYKEPVSKLDGLLKAPNSFNFPSEGPLPQKMSQYKCTATDAHYNGYILGHAYWTWIDEMNKRGVDGRTVAGTLLQHIPWHLAGQRTFGDTRWAFLQVIKGFYGTNSPVFDAYIQGFGFATNILFKHSRTQLGCATI